MATTRSGTTSAVTATGASSFDVCWPAQESISPRTRSRRTSIATEFANLPFFGYGVSSFTLSLIETAIELTGGRITGADLHGAIALARQMLTEDIELFPAAHETLTMLAANWPLMLITKGDLLHQTSKLERSGLREPFATSRSSATKRPTVYARILAGHGVEPDRFLMVGNSLRSDILPVVEAGGWALHIPAALSWSHEHADLPTARQARYFEVVSLADSTAGDPNSSLKRHFRGKLGLPRIADALRAGSRRNRTTRGSLSGLMLLALLNVLNISRLGMMSTCPPTRNGR